MREPAFKFLEERARQGSADFKMTPEGRPPAAAEHSGEVKFPAGLDPVYESIIQSMRKNNKLSREGEAALAQLKPQTIHDIFEHLSDASLKKVLLPRPGKRTCDARAC